MNGIGSFFRVMKQREIRQVRESDNSLGEFDNPVIVYCNLTEYSCHYRHKVFPLLLDVIHQIGLHDLTRSRQRRLIGKFRTLELYGNFRHVYIIVSAL